MKNIIICPVCGERLEEFDSFFNCRNFHKFNKDINRNLRLGKEKDGFLSLSDAAKIKAFKEKINISEMAKDVASQLSGANAVFISGFADDRILDALQEKLPDAFFYVTLHSQKELNFCHSGEKRIFLIGDCASFAPDSFDAAIIFGDGSFDSKTVKKSGVIIRFFCGEMHGRELICFGYPKPVPKNKIIFGFSEEKRMMYSGKIFVDPGEAVIFHRLFGKDRVVPEKLKTFGGGLVSLVILMSVYRSN